MSISIADWFISARHVKGICGEKTFDRKLSVLQLSHEFSSTLSVFEAVEAARFEKKRSCCVSKKSWKDGNQSLIRVVQRTGRFPRRFSRNHVGVDRFVTKRRNTGVAFIQRKVLLEI